MIVGALGVLADIAGTQASGPTPHRHEQRKGGDSNSRDGGCPPAGFQDRCIQPLCHPSTRNVKASGSIGYAGSRIAQAIIQRLVAAGVGLRSVDVPVPSSRDQRTARMHSGPLDTCQTPRREHRQLMVVREHASEPISCHYRLTTCFRDIRTLSNRVGPNIPRALLSDNFRRRLGEQERCRQHQSDHGQTNHCSASQSSSSPTYTPSTEACATRSSGTLRQSSRTAKTCPTPPRRSQKSPAQNPYGSRPSRQRTT
jgi:hypothetical protein